MRYVRLPSGGRTFFCGVAQFFIAFVRYNDRFLLIRRSLKKKYKKQEDSMLIAISILALAYLIMGKDVKPLIERVKVIDLRRKMNTLWDRLRPWALKAGRVASRPLLTFYYVMDAKETSTLDKVLIYGAIAYTIVPTDLLPRAVFKFLGVLDDGVAVLYVYRKIKEHITPEIEAKVENTLNEWFGVEYEIVEG